MDYEMKVKLGQQKYGSKKNVWKDYKLAPSPKDDRCNTCNKPIPTGREVYLTNDGKAYCCESCMDESKNWKINKNGD